MEMIPDRIEKHIRLAAPRSRVWKALADTNEFGRWFGVELEGPWRVGEPMRGRFTMEFSQETVDEWLDELGLPSSPVADTFPDVFCTVETLEPESRFAFRWIPYSIDAGIDPATEPRTFVEFELTDDANGTLLSVCESGFADVPIGRRKRAFLMNNGGWESQLENIARYLKSEQTA